MPRLRLASDRSFFVLEGGQHGDALHEDVLKIPGWRACKIGEHDTPKNLACYQGPTLPHSVAGLQGLRSQFSIDLEPEVGLFMQRTEARVRTVREALESRCFIMGGVGPRSLMPHQQQALSALEALIQEQGGGALLADDMGLGKTTTAMAFAKSRAAETRLLVVCPSSVKWNWHEELSLCLPHWWAYCFDGTTNAREANLASLQQAAPKNWPRVIITNYEQLGAPPDNPTEKPRSMLAENWRLFCERFVDGGLLVLDESHYVKDEKSDRSRACSELAKRARWRLLMTGTPIRNSPRDLWHQLELAVPGIWRNQWDFERRYQRTVGIRMGRRKVRKVVGWNRQAELAAIVKLYQVRRLKSVLTGLPPKMPPVVHFVEMDDVTRKHYKQMRDWWLYEFASLDDKENVFSPRARSALEASIRLAQIAQGFVSSPDGSSSWIAENSKSAWLIDMVEDILIAGRKPVVFSQFNKPLGVLAEQIKAKFEVPTILFTGDLSASDRAAELDTFKTEKKAVFLGQVKIAEGFNLTTSQDVIFYGRDWSPAVNAQAEDRVHRIGQQGTVSIYIPLVRGTIEKYMHERLLKKDETNSAVLTMAELREAI